MENKKVTFEKYQKLKLEQKRLNDRIESLLSERDDIRSRILIDGVVASDQQFPYIAHIAKVEGIVGDDDKFDNHIINLELKRVRKMQDANDLALSQIREFVDNIDDEYIKSIVTYRFIEGMSWRQVAFKMGGGNTEDSVRKSYTRYFDRIK